MVKVSSLVALLAIFAATAVAGPSEERARELKYLLRQDCGSCHGLTLKGGLGPSLLPERFRDWDARDIAEVIMNGRPGTPMPPWKFALDGNEALWMAKLLKEGVE